jgi:hypothetical protein
MKTKKLPARPALVIRDMIINGHGNTTMKHKNDRRAKDARKSWKNEAW